MFRLNGSLLCRATFVSLPLLLNLRMLEKELLHKLLAFVAEQSPSFDERLLSFGFSSSTFEEQQGCGKSDCEAITLFCFSSTTFVNFPIELM
uniref:Secreted protein n=1 Tax=Romanomermis culicivorax TaxID=13658 RepID=A0A915L7N0_ROMCU